MLAEVSGIPLRARVVAEKLFGPDQLHLRPLKLAEAYEDRQLLTQQALLEIREARPICKTVVAISQTFDGEESQKLNALFEAHPDYRWDKRQESRLWTELYKALRPMMETGKMIDVANRLVKLQRV